MQSIENNKRPIMDLVNEMCERYKNKEASASDLVSFIEDELARLETISSDALGKLVAFGSLNGWGGLTKTAQENVVKLAWEEARTNYDNRK